MELGGTNTDSDNWKKVLLEIYRFAPNLWGDSIKMNSYDPRNSLAKRCGFKNSELGNIILFLEDQKLIETRVDVGNKEYSASWILTEKGFDVSLELEKQIRGVKEKIVDRDTQLIISFLTFILAITGIANFAKDIYPSYSNYYFLLYFIFIIFFTIGLIIIRKSNKF